MLTVTVRNGAFALEITGHMYVASGCLFVWDKTSIVTLQLHQIKRAFMYPDRGLILDVK